MVLSTTCNDTDGDHEHNWVTNIVIAELRLFKVAKATLL